MSIVIESLILLASACIFVPIFKRLKLGAILGYLTAGAIIGPHALSLVKNHEAIMHVSELGVVFFLFLVGIELEPKRLFELRRTIFGLGNAQLIATAVVVIATLLVFGVSLPASFVIGVGLALSSTAIALQLIADRGHGHSKEGHAGFAILLFQDIAVIPLLAMIPLLTGDKVELSSAAIAAVKVVGVVVAVIVASRLFMRPLFRLTTKSKAHEVNIALALLIVVGTGAAMSSVGLSMGMGAFLAGVLLADSEYRHELEANVEPFKGLLLGLFFIAIGMTIDMHVLMENPVIVMASVVGLVALKTMVLVAIGRFSKWEPKASLIVAAALSQGGEFAFVLFGVAKQAAILTEAQQSLLVMIVSFSMVSTPLLMIIVDRYLLATAKADDRAFDEIAEEHPVIIAGFGRYGQIVARVLTAANVRFTALEISTEQVDFVRRFGNKIYYGDASRLELLRAAKADEAKAFVLAIDDVEASVRTAAVVRKAFPHLRVYARARNRAHVYKLLDLGVDVLNRETFYSSVKMGQRLITDLGMSEADAEALVKRFIDHDEELLQRQYAVHNDEQQLIQTSKDARAELQAIFDAEAIRRTTEATAGKPS